MRRQTVVLVLGTALLLAMPVLASVGCGAGGSGDSAARGGNGGSGGSAPVDPAALCPAACEFLLRCAGGAGPTFEQCVASCGGGDELEDPCQREQGADCVRCFAEAVACNELDSCARVACNEQRCEPACGGCEAGELCECETSDACACVANPCAACVPGETCDCDSGDECVCVDEGPCGACAADERCECESSDVCACVAS